MLTRPPKPPGHWTWSSGYGTWTQTLAQASENPAVVTAPASPDDDDVTAAPATGAPNESAPAPAAPEDEPLPAAAARSLTGGPTVGFSQAEVAAMYARRHETRIAAATAAQQARSRP
jgi:hypothetical protein